MENKKYQIRYDLAKEVNGRTLYRIEALKSFKNVKNGDLGGYIESEGNLSQEGNCWVYDDACVFENAVVEDNAKVYGTAKICGHNHLNDDSIVSIKNSKLNDIICISGVNNFTYGIKQTNRNYGKFKS
jgi:bacterial transferase hexapeptide repeat protein